MLFKLPNVIYSPQLLEAAIVEIDRHIQWQQQSSMQRRVGAASVAGSEPNYSQETRQLIDVWVGERKAVTISVLQDLLRYLRNQKLPVLHLTFAALPNQAQRSVVVKWVRNNISDGVLVSFTADRTIGGGVVIRTPSHFIDASWQTQLTAARDKMGDIVRNV